MPDTAYKFRKSLLFFSKGAMLLLMGAIMLLFWWFKYPEATYYGPGNYLVVFFYIALLLIISSVYGATKIGIFRLGEIIYSFLLSLLICNLLFYVQLSLVARGMLFPAWMLVGSIAQFGVAVIGSFYINRLYFQLYPAREVAVIYSKKDQARYIINKMSLKKERYRVCVVVSEDEPFERICEVIDGYSSIMLCDIDQTLRLRLFSYCSLHGKRVYIIPGFQDVLIRSANSTQLFDTPVFYCKNTGPSTEMLMVKRFTDIVGASLGILISSPFMLLIALAIKLFDGGPILYKQDRLTLDGKVFRLYKFRSMIVNAEENGIARLASVGDDRITPVGRVIRRLRLDELPQFFNVLGGSMSLVGPRPERPEIAAQYEREMPEFALRLRMKAGLTGYAQVNGRYNTTMRDKLLLDLLYIETYSPVLDFNLLFITLKILFMPESTEGIEAGTYLPSEEGYKPK